MSNDVDVEAILHARGRAQGGCLERIEKGALFLAARLREVQFGKGASYPRFQARVFRVKNDEDSRVAEAQIVGEQNDVFQWIRTNSRTPRAAWEVDAWSSYMEKRGPDSDRETLEFFADYVGKCSMTRDDIKTWFEAIELDDYVTFGGHA